MGQRRPAEPVAAAGLKHLHGLSKLKFLEILDTGVTDAGVKALQTALPNCKITR